ncbi:hypothetical protein [Stackebrandtia nassauensis]|uniref:Uncharacterized protein n=1 Tax=Stackebrandtia nassauensis (strain DSM 44728 / CIP 108903 / NRRL B-16338 / NBRC 102104 / LLR-40K-21) TaxID=446470 RepID=D3Q5H8_STANL|nr:hypothetical protein [Stackebrandtia nassauensis]ADD46038.1 hypothetical protein Snas_6422 [Stackebrandtia nassauensis DSM 44728]
MTYPPQPGGQDPYGQQQPGYGQQPGYSPQQPVTGVPSSPAGGYGQPAYPPQQPPGYGMGTPVPEPGDRPGMVTTAAMLMVAMTVISLLMGALGIYFSIEDANSSISEDAASVGRTVSIVVGVLYLVVGIGVIVLALGVLRGYNWARITTWVVYGLFALCGLCGLLGSFGILSETSTTSTDTTGGIIVMLGLVLMLVIEGITVGLLAAPVSNQWFREVSLAKRAGVI